MISPMKSKFVGPQIRRGIEVGWVGEKGRLGS